MADKVPLKIDAGATYPHDFFLVDKNAPANPIDLTGYSARMQIRPSKKSTILYYDSEVGGDVTITDAAAGKITVYIPAATSEGWSFTRGYYDLEAFNPGGDVIRVAEGTVCVDPNVTR